MNLQMVHIFTNDNLTWWFALNKWSVQRCKHNLDSFIQEYT